jgi:hypothetical protein
LFEPTGSRRDAASVIFNLPGYRVVDAVDLPLGGRRVRVQPVDLADGCPACGVISAGVHAWIVQRVRDIPHGGQREVMVRKPRQCQGSAEVGVNHQPKLCKASTEGDCQASAEGTQL